MTVTLDVIATLTARRELDNNELEALLHALINERRQAYEAGRRDERQALREASIAIRKATDWPQLINDLDDVTRQRAHRAIMLNPAPRPGDHPGRSAGAA